MVSGGTVPEVMDNDCRYVGCNHGSVIAGDCGDYLGLAQVF